MQWLWDFLSFRRMVSPSLLLAMYYLGAVVLPLLVWRLVNRVLRRRWLEELAQQAISVGDELLSRLPFSLRLKLALAFVGVLVLMELFWRMMFEFLVAYFQMRGVLLGLEGMRFAF